MKKKIVFIIALLIVLLSLCSCGKSSYFTITFLDVGQGDSALVECDGHYMLIDGGKESAKDKVYSILEEKGIQRLDILAISHLHDDHYGGLIKALKYASTIDLTISNSDDSSNKTFEQLQNQLNEDGAKITIPSTGTKYNLGSAKIEVIDNASDEDNDSLVLLITYGKNKFLFTGDIEQSAQTRISDKYENESDKAYDVDLIKMPHHGQYSGTLYRFLRTFMPKYAVISVGANNQYGHPEKNTLDLLEQEGAKIYRTDQNGDITVKSNGKNISIETSK